MQRWYQNLESEKTYKDKAPRRYSDPDTNLYINEVCVIFTMFLHAFFNLEQFALRQRVRNYFSANHSKKSKFDFREKESVEIIQIMCFVGYRKHSY